MLRVSWSLDVKQYLTVALPSRQGDHVWLESLSNSEYNVPIGAVVKISDSGQILVEDDEGKVGYVITSSAEHT